MARKKPETPIEVCTFFDGELDIAQVFTNLIAEKIHQQKTKKPLVNTDLTVHNEGEVPNHTASGLCG